jgi:hypothetical protein
MVRANAGLPGRGGSRRRRRPRAAPVPDEVWPADRAQAEHACLRQRPTYHARSQRRLQSRSSRRAPSPDPVPPGPRRRAGPFSGSAGHAGGEQRQGRKPITDAAGLVGHDRAAGGDASSKRHGWLVVRRVVDASDVQDPAATGSVIAQFPIGKASEGGRRRSHVVTIAGRDGSRVASGGHDGGRRPRGNVERSGNGTGTASGGGCEADRPVARGRARRSRADPVAPDASHAARNRRRASRPREPLHGLAPGDGPVGPSPLAVAHHGAHPPCPGRPSTTRPVDEIALIDQARPTVGVGQLFGARRAAGRSIVRRAPCRRSSRPSRRRSNASIDSVALA